MTRSTRFKEIIDLKPEEEVWGKVYDHLDWKIFLKVEDEIWGTIADQITNQICIPIINIVTPELQ